MTMLPYKLFKFILPQLNRNATNLFELLDSAMEWTAPPPVSYTHLRAHETRHDLVCRLLLETNEFFAYPDNIIISLLANEDDTKRRKALQIFHIATQVNENLFFCNLIEMLPICLNCSIQRWSGVVLLLFRKFLLSR